MTANNDIRRIAAGAGIRLWQIADKLGYTDSYFSRKLRHELSPKEKANIHAIIKELSPEFPLNEKNQGNDDVSMEEGSTA